MSIFLRRASTKETCQVSNTSAQVDPQLQQACLLVGRFMYHFALVEQKIDQAVIKLLGLDARNAPIVIGLLDFAKKAELVRTSADLQAQTAKDKINSSGKHAAGSFPLMMLDRLLRTPLLSLSPLAPECNLKGQ
jgi:hypothetical protein